MQRRRSSAAAAELDDLRGQVQAISRSNAVIEFALDGTIQNANETFPEHGGLFARRSCAVSITASSSRRPNASLRLTRRSGTSWRRGEYRAGQYKRIAKNGREVWLQASYNPILDVERQAVQGREVLHRHHCAEGPGGGLRGADQRRSTRRRRSSSSSWMAPSCASTRTSCAPWATRSTSCGASITACSSIAATGGFGGVPRVLGEAAPR